MHITVYNVVELSHFSQFHISWRENMKLHVKRFFFFFFPDKSNKTRSVQNYFIVIRPLFNQVGAAEN